MTANQIDIPFGWSGEFVIISQDVMAERWNQLRKWGTQHHPDPNRAQPGWYAALADLSKQINDKNNAEGRDNWTDILLEEVYEALAEEDPAKLRAELVQAAAVIFAWIEDLDGRANEEAA